MGFFGYSEATNPCERAVTKMIKLPNISEDTRVLLGQIQKEIKSNPDAYTIGILVDKITHVKEIDALRSVIAEKRAEKNKYEAKAEAAAEIENRANMQLLDIIGARSPQIMGAVDMGADGAIVVQDNENGVQVVKDVITGDQRAQELEERAKVLAECQAKDEKIALLQAKVEDGVEIKLQATRLFCSMARRGRRHRGDVDNSLVDFHTGRRVRGILAKRSGRAAETAP